MKERKESRKPGSDTRYTYAVGRIKALEARLISPAEMDRLMQEETHAEVLRTLAEFPDYVDIVATAGREPEDILEQQLNQVYDLVSDLSLGAMVIRVLRLKYDFHNLKSLLKARLLSVDPEGFSTVGFLSLEQLTRILEQKKFEGDVDPFVGEVMVAAVARVGEDAGPNVVETTLDRFYYELFLKALSVNPFLHEYARRTIDLINLRTFWRVQIMGWSEERLTESLLPGGTIEQSFLTANLSTPMPDLLPKVTDEAYRRILRQALSAYQAKSDLSVLDRLIDDFLIEFLREAKHYCFGLEPLVGYIAAKENEVMRLRTILYGKGKNLPAETLRELFRRSYA